MSVFVNVARVMFIRAAFRRFGALTIDLFFEIFFVKLIICISFAFLSFRVSCLFFTFLLLFISRVSVSGTHYDRKSRRGGLAETGFIRHRINLSIVPLSKNNMSVSITG